MGRLLQLLGGICGRRRKEDSEEDSNEQVDAPLIECLPEEMMMEILLHVPNQDLIRCNRVSTSWERLASDRVQWEKRLENVIGKTACRFASPLLSVQEMQKIVMSEVFPGVQTTDLVTAYTLQGYGVAGAVPEYRSSDHTSFSWVEIGPYPGCRGIWACTDRPSCCITFSIDLFEHGLNRSVMDALQPSIRVSLCIGFIAHWRSQIMWSAWLNDIPDMESQFAKYWVDFKNPPYSSPWHCLALDLPWQPNFSRYLHVRLEGLNWQTPLSSYGFKFTMPKIQFGRSLDTRVASYQDLSVLPQTILSIDIDAAIRQRQG